MFNLKTWHKQLLKVSTMCECLWLGSKWASIKLISNKDLSLSRLVVMTKCNGLINIYRLYSSYRWICPYKTCILIVVICRHRMRSFLFDRLTFFSVFIKMNKVNFPSLISNQNIYIKWNWIFIFLGGDDGHHAPQMKRPNNTNKIPTMGLWIGFVVNVVDVGAMVAIVVVIRHIYIVSVLN